MKGFTDGIAVSVAVAWLKNAAGVYTEVPLLNAEPLPYGLLAETFNTGTGVTTRWFVPWTSVVYIKQDQPLPVPTQEAVAPVAPAAPLADPPSPTRKVR